MKKSDEIIPKWYIPQDLVVGLEDSRNIHNQNIENPAIVVCKFKQMTWTNDNEFKKMTGFIRGNSRDASQTIRRDLAGSKMDISNEPTAGFKITSDKFFEYKTVEDNSSRPNRNYYNSISVVDPRGFTVGITVENLVNLIQTSKMGQGGLIESKLVYIWKERYDCGRSNLPMKFPWLVSVEDKLYKEHVKSSKAIDDAILNPKAKFTRKDIKDGDVLLVKNRYGQMHQYVKIPTTMLKNLDVFENLRYYYFISDLDYFKSTYKFKEGSRYWSSSYLYQNSYTNDATRIGKLAPNCAYKFNSEQMPWNDSNFIERLNILQDPNENVPYEYIDLDLLIRINNFLPSVISDDFSSFDLDEFSSAAEALVKKISYKQIVEVKPYLESKFYQDISYKGKPIELSTIFDAARSLSIFQQKLIESFVDFFLDPITTPEAFRNWVESDSEPNVEWKKGLLAKNKVATSSNK